MTNHTDDIRIICEEDCGNAPKKRLLRDLNIAFARNDTAFVQEQMADDVVWNMVGDRKVSGKAQFAEALEQMDGGKASELRIDHIITHGRTGAVNGMLRFGEKQYAFCDVYVFNSAGKNAKIKEITSYVVDVT